MGLLNNLHCYLAWGESGDFTDRLLLARNDGVLVVNQQIASLRFIPLAMTVDTGAIVRNEPIDKQFALHLRV